MSKDKSHANIGITPEDAEEALGKIGHALSTSMPMFKDEGAAGMNNLEYSFEEIRSIEASTVNGGAVMDSYRACISVERLSFEQMQELRGIIEEFCRGEEWAYYQGES
jgi:hypothetical protein